MSMIVLAALGLQISEAPQIQIADFVGEIIVEQGSVLSVNIERTEDNRRVDITEQSDGLIIDGGQSIRGWGCHGRGGTKTTGRSRWQAKRFDEYPLLIIQAPEPTNLKIEKSIIRGKANDLAKLDLHTTNCGDFNTGNILGPVSAVVSGSFKLDLGHVEGNMDVSVSGSGDLTAGNIKGPLDLNISGSGDVRTGDIIGALEVRTSGSGSVETGDVDGSVDYSASGSGNLTVEHIKSLTMSSAGSSSFKADSLHGDFDVRLSGSSNVNIDSGRATNFRFISSGSGSLKFGGIAVDPDIRLTGSGSARIGGVEGMQAVRSSGSGRLKVTGQVKLAGQAD